MRAKWLERAYAARYSLPENGRRTLMLLHELQRRQPIGFGASQSVRSAATQQIVGIPAAFDTTVEVGQRAVRNHASPADLGEQNKKLGVGTLCRLLIFCLERATGLEPVITAWEAVVLPLHHARIHRNSIALGRRDVKWQFGVIGVRLIGLGMRVGGFGTFVGGVASSR